MSGTKISAVGTSFANTGFGNLSAGFRISAGNNLTISTAANNTIQLNANDTGITSISAKNGSSTAKFTGPNISFSAGEGVGFNTNTSNVITISAEGKTYSDGRYINISGTNNSINVTDPLVNSAQSGQSAYNWITTKSATLSAGPGIGFFSAADRVLGISAEGSTYHDGNYIEVDNTNKQINLSSNISATNISSDNIMLSKQTMGQGSYTANLTFSSMYMTTYGQPSYKLLFDGVNVSAAAPDQSYPGTPKPTVTAAITWYELMEKCGGNYVSASGNQSITLATATSALTPSDMNPGIIYLV